MFPEKVVLFSGNMFIKLRHMGSEIFIFGHIDVILKAEKIDRIYGVHPTPKERSRQSARARFELKVSQLWSRSARSSRRKMLTELTEFILGAMSVLTEFVLSSK